MMGWIIFINETYHYSLDEKEKKIVSSLLQKPEIRYFGFFSIALPDNFTPSGMFMTIQGGDMTRVETKLQFYPPFQQSLIRREDTLKKTRPDRVQDIPYLKQVYQLPSGMNGIIFEYISEDAISDVFRTLEAYKWVDGVSFLIKMKAQDARAKKYDNDRDRFNLKYNVSEKKKSY